MPTADAIRISERAMAADREKGEEEDAVVYK